MNRILRNHFCIVTILLITAFSIHLSTLSASVIDQELILTKTDRYKSCYAKYKEEIFREISDFKKLNFTILTNKEKNIIAPQTGADQYLLRDNSGDLWLFKPVKNSSKYNIAGGVLGYRLYKLLGSETPEAHEFTIEFKGRDIKGYLQRFIPKALDIKTSDLILLSQKQVQYVIAQEALDWFLISNDTDFIITRNTADDGLEIIGVDKDETLTPEQDFSLQDIYTSLWDYYIKGEKFIDLDECIAKLRYISEFPDEIIIEIVQPYINQLFQCYESGEYFSFIDDNDQKIYLKNEKDFCAWLIERKKQLYQKMSQRYSNFQEKRRKNLEYVNN